MKVNFKEVEVYTDLSKTKSIKGDARKEFANLLYNSCNGVVAHSLAIRVYESDGEIEVSPQEATLIKNMAEQHCTPAFIDGITKQLNSK